MPTVQLMYFTHRLAIYSPGIWRILAGMWLKDSCGIP